MSRDPEEVSKLTESTYKNVMEQFNPGLRNLVTLGKNYEKAVGAMNLAGKTYFEAVSKIGENAAVSPVSRELGVVLMEISEAHKKIHLELEENFKIFHKEIITELEKKTDMDVKYMNATFKRYQSEHKMKQDSVEKSQYDLKKLRKKSQGKNNSKYQSRENEYLETLSSRQMDMQMFVADGCKEALVEEKRRFCFLVDKHCAYAYHVATFHEKAKELLASKVPCWQDKCCDATDVPETVVSMIEGLKSVTPQPSPSFPHEGNHVRANSDSVIPPPAPPLKAHSSPLTSMFTPDPPTAPIVADHSSDYSEASSLSRSVSVSSGLNTVKRPKVQTIFPHTAENNDTLLSFEEGDVVTLLIPDERDGWLYGELDRTGLRGWFPSSYCRLYSESLTSSSPDTSAHSSSMLNLTQPGGEEYDDDDEDDVPVILPPADYVDSPSNSDVSLPLTPTSESPVSQANGLPTLPFLGGGNPFLAVKLRPTVTNDRSAPAV
ncbi:brain-specific angiogenesis inhibitor 1-associated protein 2-like protein 1b isoform X2 [Anguilla anguilla]|uniref:brain-specific angiogenesis inhibitor 1-associated protein 2-like protein 1b isoform X2 n=1 Tax=Anguilla anguilla TaxID=7936 RepID=UPI0015AE4C62|nr:brain-specific angiogenesis inhibitor 1-associated protein 2-like protein 1b isoform X2 [Anguilla anguilla]